MVKLVGSAKRPMIQTPRIFALLFLAATVLAGERPRGTSAIPSSEQRKGEAKDGFNYLTTGNYVGSGIPRDTFFSVFGMQAPNHLKRKGMNTFVPYDFTEVKAPNGVPI